MTIFTDIPSQLSSVISIKGYVDPIPMGVMTVTPRKIAASSLRVNQATDVSVDIFNTGNADFTVDRMVSRKFKTLYFDAATSGRVIVHSGEKKTVVIRVVPTVKGRFIDFLMIHSDARNCTSKGYKVVLVGNVE